VDQCLFGAVATDGSVWMGGRMTMERLRTCQFFSWNIRCTVFSLKPSRKAAVR